MNICFVSPNVNVYSETFIVNLKNGLEGKLFHCHNGLVPTQCEGVNLSGSHSILVRLAKRIGIIKYSLTEHYFYTFLKRNKIDVIVANYGTCGASIAPLAAALKIPLVVHFHGYDASVTQVVNQYKERYRSMFCSAKAVVVVSREMHTDLINLGAPQEKLHILTYAPDPKYLEINPSYNSNQVLAVGRFVEKKAPHLTLIAFSKAVKLNPLLKLKMVGDGPLLPICNDLVKAMSIPNVEFSGVLPADEVIKEFSRSFCFVQHSKMGSDGDKEGTPVAILESLAAAIPVVSTKHAGIPDVIDESYGGYLVEEGDVDGMAEYIFRLSKDRLLAQTIGKQGRQKIRNEYNPERYFAEWNALLEQLLAK